jgi:endonuclease/exonuclease/phosphatase family metal-dependent hydrolase
MRNKINKINKKKTQKNKVVKYIQKGGFNLSVQALTYNLSWASQKNVVAGSEEDFVRRCNFLNRNCYEEALNKIEELHKEINFDVIGIQEVEDPELVTKIRKKTGLQGWYRGATWNSKAKAYSGCAIFWNTDLLGTMASSKTINLVQPDDAGECDARTCCIINTTKDINLIVAHFPWLNNEDDVSNISKIISTHISTNGPIIILADTNDSKTLISKENPLIIKNKALSHGLMEQEAKTILNSCCWHEHNHKNYKHLTDTGDYILSENVENIRIPIIRPTNYKTDTRLYSDHMPVIANVILKVTNLTTQRTRQSSQKKSYKKIYAKKFRTMYDKFNTLKSQRWVTIE